MAAKHEAKAGQQAAQRTGPERTEPRDPDQEDDPAQVIRDVFGDAIVWEAEFHHHTDAEGKPIYVHAETGQVFTAMPQLHHADGKPA